MLRFRDAGSVPADAYLCEDRMTLTQRKSSILAVVFIWLLSACGQSQSAASSPLMATVGAKEFAFTPAALTVTVGQPVTINFQNSGSVEHDWSIREIDLSGQVTSSDDAQSGHMMGGMGEQPKLHVAASAGGKGT